MSLCAVYGCTKEGAHLKKRGRVGALVCEDHVNTIEKVIEPMKLDKPTTGSKVADKMVNQAVDYALLRLAPIIRDVMREEIKRFVQLEPCDDKDQTA